MSLEEFRYICPNPDCQQGFDKAIKKQCPHCQADLKYQMHNEPGQKQRGFYVLAGDRVSSSGETEDPDWITLDQDYGMVVSQSVNDEDQYRVTYSGQFQNTWLVCPKCGKRQAQNNILVGSITIKCTKSNPKTNKKCRGVTEYVFQS